MTSVQDIAKASELGGAHAVSAINTLLLMIAISSLDQSLALNVSSSKPGFDLASFTAVRMENNPDLTGKAVFSTVV